ncbi:MAG: hypothetical protein K8S54_02405 [Spirochaetia bacterium]|nr:hypothetical protein [Spirochaetia bacterium]
MRQSLALILLILTASLYPDRLILKSGKVLNGTIRSGGNGDVILQTAEGSRMIIPRDEILEGNLTFQGPRACLQEKTGKETCDHLIEAISKSGITLVDESTGERALHPWTNYISASFKNLNPEQVSNRIIPAGMRVEVSDKETKTSRGIVTTSEQSTLILEQGNQREQIQLERINNLTIQNPTIQKTGFNWPGYGFLLPGIQQIRSKDSRIKGAVLLGGSILFAGLAGWSASEATRARSASSTFLPLGGSLAVLGNGNANRFNRARTLNHIALVGLGAIYLGNGLDLSRNRSSSAVALQPEIRLAWSIHF